MTRVDLQIHDDAMMVLSKIKHINDSGIDIVIPEGSVLFDNVLNLKLIEQQAEKAGISVQFTTNDEAGNMLLSMLEGKPETVFNPDTLNEEDRRPTFQKHGVKIPQLGFKLPKIPGIKINLNLGKKRPIVIITVVIVTLIATVVVATGSQKAQVKIVLSTLPLTRSVPVKVKVGATTNPDTSVLKGNSVEGTLEGSSEIPTTGEVLVGEKADGKVYIYNYDQDNDITLKKGATLTYDSSTDLDFSLDSETTISAATKESTAPGSSTIPGKKEASVTAVDIGSAYNISKGKSLEISKYKKSVLEAEAKEDFSGGKSEKVKAVSEIDRTSISKAVLDQNVKSAETILRSKLGVSQKLISGSIKATLVKEVYSNAVGDKTNKITLNQTVSVSGLSYLTSDLDDILGKIIYKLVPSGFTLSKKDWGISVEVLGNSTSSILSPTEADLQATLKTLVVPTVDENQIKKDLAGKSPSDAEKYLGSIKNIKSYELTISPPLPLLRKVPKDINQINLVIENE